jgi:transcriptional regulator with XRE-family HTH domain
MYNSNMNTDTDNKYIYTDKDFSDALKELMDKKKWSYNKLSYRCELSGQYLHQLVNKKSLPPKDENIRKIAGAFNLEPEYFKEYRNRRLSEKMLQSDESDSDGKKHYDMLLSPEEIRKLEIIISEVKEKFSK